nr:hypothetical protein 3 [Campylobacterota bacterium]
MVTGLSECGTWFEKTCVKAAYWLRKASNLTSIKRFLKFRRVEVCSAGDFTKKQLRFKGESITDKRLKKIQRMNKQRLRRYRSYLQDQNEKLKKDQ